MPQPRQQQLSTRRGGARNAPVHVLQIVISTLLLVASAALLISGSVMIGLVLLVAGGAVAFLNLKR
jgi:hypothetical protein